MQQSKNYNIINYWELTTKMKMPTPIQLIPPNSIDKCTINLGKNNANVKNIIPRTTAQIAE